MIAVDTSVWIDLLRGRDNAQTAWLKERVWSVEIVVIDLVYFEVMRGVRRSESVTTIRNVLRSCVPDSTGGEALADRAAANARLLGSKGITVRSSIDCLLATRCIEREHTLLHNDRDFDAYEKHLGLRVLHV